MPTRREIGAWGEAVAARHLEAAGYAIRDRNWRHDHGELDLVAEQAGLIVFVEVRARHGEAAGAPEETLGPAKRAKLEETARAYLERHGLTDAPARFDVIAIDFDARHAVRRLDHYEAAL